jgi:hypothetical protein
MTEPIYEFIKGKGWVPESPVLTTMLCGTVVRLEPRKPNVGEQWLRSGGWVDDDGNPIMPRFIRCLQGDWTGYNELFASRNVDDEDYLRMQEDDSYGYVTVTRYG